MLETGGYLCYEIRTRGGSFTKTERPQAFTFFIEFRKNPRQRVTAAALLLLFCFSGDGVYGGT